MDANNPLSKLSEEEQARWHDTIANCAAGESECQHETGAEDHHIEEFMLEADHERCPQCQWFMPSYEFLDDDGEALDSCEDCRGE